MMKISTITLLLIGVVSLKGDLKHGRMSIIPEYDQNLVTILFSGHRLDSESTVPFQFTVPDDVDSVSFIQNKSGGELDFIQIPTQLINNQKWVEVSSTLPEFAFMINSTEFNEPGNRHFEYNLIFSEKIIEFNLEIMEPLAAENFTYDGFDGETSKDAHGQTTHLVQWTNISANDAKSISLSYLNARGLSTKSVLAELMGRSQKEMRPTMPVEKVKRHKLYIWEPLIALSVVSVLIIIILLNVKNKNESNMNCSNCGSKIKSSGKFCPNCGGQL
ncbi:MAG: zinc ribbon domain-containing protein [Candidatus Marinimicrobia bacterium]|nr:zinc ribbon domain-containing protein [Candidatus Neomarinimicrobiota bacterium]MBT3998877.1 zinc ribbon domain-containing protein [Candidatus Neomarinimicrobiota bacterium]MBT4283079.1 zinc ribbon domain-containing protein [Candidatus Neomarinimicrobiota bacterium]MBT4579940.1 zinc ribbon domain-containing protein [Candidatus Neomarinimicrobiota bacterium]MBT4956681.1 zinc ribbon domain-containing protein [Candidatus Neomarinimicrobiota bacterium]